MKKILFSIMWKTKNEMSKGELLYLRLGYYMVTKRIKGDENIYYKIN